MNDAIQYLIEQLATGRATEAERQQLMEFLQQAEHETAFKNSVDQLLQTSNADYALDNDTANEILESILLASKQYHQPSRLITIRRVAIAACIVGLIGITAWFFAKTNNNPGKPETLKSNIAEDFAPGRDGAVLTLANGSTIILDNLANGKITDAAIKEGNRISYQNTQALTIESNTMSTPKGRQYSLVLADGTKVWLNASSSITYPTAFISSERKVEVTGEVYFEVAHDRSKPFYVAANGMEVQVLGTHFNINSYEDEGPVKTTLLEGSIKVFAGNKTQFIKPGQQAKVADGNIQLLKDVDTDQVMAWKNGYFSFKGESIYVVMRQLARWYDIDVSYEGNNTETFSGKIGRNLTLKELLDGLGESKVHYRLEEGKHVVIMP